MAGALAPPAHCPPLSQWSSISLTRWTTEGIGPLPAQLLIPEVELRYRNIQSTCLGKPSPFLLVASEAEKLWTIGSGLAALSFRSQSVESAHACGILLASGMRH